MATLQVTLAMNNVTEGINWSVKLSTSSTNARAGIDADTVIADQYAYYVYPVVPTPATFGLTSLGSSYLFSLSFLGEADSIRTYGNTNLVDKYTTFRSINSPDQFTTSGASMDIFSDSLADQATTKTWRNVSGVGNSMSCYTNKHSLVYMYSNVNNIGQQWAPCWSKGGNLTVTLTTINTGP